MFLPKCLKFGKLKIKFSQILLNFESMKINYMKLPCCFVSTWVEVCCTIICGCGCDCDEEIICFGRDNIAGVADVANDAGIANFDGDANVNGVVSLENSFFTTPVLGLIFNLDLCGFNSLSLNSVSVSFVNLFLYLFWLKFSIASWNWTSIGEVVSGLK